MTIATTYECKKCANTITLYVNGSAYCLKCSRPMRRSSNEEHAPQTLKEAA